MSDHSGISRRSLLVGSGAAGVAGASIAYFGKKSSAVQSKTEVAKIGFYGVHQSGIENTPGLISNFVAFDLIDPTKANLQSVLRLFTDDAARLTQGKPALADGAPELAVNPANLTMTLGVGPSLFTRVPGLPSKPDFFNEIPAFPNDQLDPKWSGSDFIIQFCCDDSLTLSHAVGMIAKDLSTLAQVRWIQTGARSDKPAFSGTTSVRNLMGQVEGSDNPLPGNPIFNSLVWINEGPQWAKDGSILILRRIQMLMDKWEILDRSAQEMVIGRRLDNGAALGNKVENEPVNFEATDTLGLPLISANAHIRLAHGASLSERIYRRPYNYDNGIVDGKRDLGLIFAAFTSNPVTSYLPIQGRLAQSDSLNKWITAIGSSTYLILPGCTENGYIGETLFT